MELLSLTIAFVAALAAGFIGTIIGGGGLISIPALIFLGLPPQTAIATNKVGGIGLVTAGLYKFHKGKKVDYRTGIIATIFATIGAFFGAHTLLKIPNDVLEKLVGIIILVMLVIILFNKDIGIKKLKIKSSLMKYFGYASFILIGFWGGLFAAGYAIFATYAFLFFFKKTFLETAGTQKLLAFGIIPVTVIIFALNGIIDWLFGAVLVVGMAIGSYIGASYALKKGDKWVKWLFVIVVVASAIKLLL